MHHKLKIIPMIGFYHLVLSVGLKVLEWFFFLCSIYSFQ